MIDNWVQRWCDKNFEQSLKSVYFAVFVLFILLVLFFGVMFKVPISISIPIQELSKNEIKVHHDFLTKVPHRGKITIMHENFPNESVTISEIDYSNPYVMIIKLSEPLQSITGDSRLKIGQKSIIGLLISKKTHDTAY